MPLPVHLPSRSWCGRDFSGGVGSVLCFSIAKGPVFLLHLDQADKYVFPAQLQTFMQTIRNGFVEALLRLQSSSGVKCDLQENAIIRPMNAKIIVVKLQIVFGMFSNDLEPIILRNLECLDHRAINNLAKLFAILGR